MGIRGVGIKENFHLEGVGAWGKLVFFAREG